MPLLDHFHRPLSTRHPWQSVHGAWANAIVQQLNQAALPERYYALPNVQFGGKFEIDVAALDEPAEVPAIPSGAVAVWAPVKASLVMPVDWADLDVVEVQVIDETAGRIVAAIELVSPANKDRPASRAAFAMKCGALLQSGVFVAIVDIVTDRSANLLNDLWQLLRLGADSEICRAELYAAALRTVTASGGPVLEIWPEWLALNQALPTLPLWLGPDLALPLDLESSYLAACRTLRLRS
ncbi:MAG: DUF4058 family protein [Pirellulaceae bacterium]|nr:DUF4058 family protein [Pirellulaceae bacterium]